MLVCWAIAHIELSRIREKPAESFYGFTLKIILSHFFLPV